MARSGDQQKKCYPPAQVNPILIRDEVQQLDPAQRSCGQGIKKKCVHACVRVCACVCVRACVCDQC